MARAFEQFLRANLTGKGIPVLSNPEMLFAYHIELNQLRTTAADENRALLLLPGGRSRGRIIMFHEMEDSDYRRPTNLKMLEGYSGDKPNPDLWAFVEQHVNERPFDPETDDYSPSPLCKHLHITNRRSPPNDLHMYWSKKSHDHKR